MRLGEKPSHQKMHIADVSRIQLYVCRCHSGFVPARKCSGGTYLLADLFPRNISASVDVPPGTFPHTQKCSGQRKCSASALACAFLVLLQVVLQSSSEVNVLTNKSTGILVLSLDLSHNDKEIPLSPTAWITDTILRQQIYDSLFVCLPHLSKAQIASLFCSKQDVIETHIMDVKLQVCIITVQNWSLLPHNLCLLSNSVRYI